MKKFIFFLVIALVLIFPILLITLGVINFNSLKSITTSNTTYSDDNYQYKFTENTNQKLDNFLELEKYNGYTLEKLTKKLGDATYLINYQPISNNIDSRILDVAIYRYDLKDPIATYFYFIDGEFYKSKNDEFNGIDTENLDSYLESYLYEFN